MTQHFFPSKENYTKSVCENKCFNEGGDYLSGAAITITSARAALCVVLGAGFAYNLVEMRDRSSDWHKLFAGSCQNNRAIRKEQIMGHLGDVSNFNIRVSQPGDASYVGYLHMKLFQRVYDFQDTFESYVLKGLVDFLNDSSGGELWVAEINNEIIASIAIVKSDDETAQLRWFLVTEQCQGKGIGKALMKTALQFCKDTGYQTVILWTTENLNTARHLYAANGFTLVETVANSEWTNDTLLEERWALDLDGRELS